MSNPSRRRILRLRATCTAVACALVCVAGGEAAERLAPPAASAAPAGWVNPLDFGAAGDGKTDDLEALRKAEAHALASGQGLWLPSGRAFAFKGRFACRVNLSGYGATLRPLAPWEGRNNLETLSNSPKWVGDGASDLVYEGFTVDAGGRSFGLVVLGGRNVTVRNVRVRDTNTAGIAAYLAQDLTIRDNYVERVRFPIQGVLADPKNGGADGIAVRGCDRPTIVNNRVTDFQRIGIVVEQHDGRRSNEPIVASNRVWNAHSEKLSSDERNACIWVENTNGGSITSNDCFELVTGRDQEVNLVRGIVVGHGETRADTVRVRGNRVDMTGTAGTVAPAGTAYVFTGTLGLRSVEFEGNAAERTGQSGVMVLGKMGQVTIRDFHSIGHRPTSVSHGIVTAYNATIRRLLIDNVHATDLDNRSGGDKGSDLDWSDILIAGNVNAGSLEIRSVAGLALTNRASAAAVGRLVVSDSHLLFGTATGVGSLEASEVLVSNSRLERRQGARVGDLFHRGGGGDGAAVRAHVSNSRIVGDVDLGMADPHEITFAGCRFEDGTVRISAANPKGTRSLTQFVGCTFDRFDGRAGAIQVGGRAEGDEQFLVKDCTFLDAKEGAPEPIRFQGSRPPDTVVVQGTESRNTKLLTPERGGLRGTRVNDWRGGAP